MKTTTLKSLWTRKLAGEKVKALAAEKGVTTAALLGAWKKAGYYKQQVIDEQNARKATHVAPSAPVPEAIDYDSIIRRRAAGEKLSVLAAEIGLSHNALCGRLDRLAAGRPAVEEKPAKIEYAIPSAKVVRKLLARHLGGEKMGALAASVGLSHNKLTALFDALKAANAAA